MSVQQNTGPGFGGLPKNDQNHKLHERKSPINAMLKGNEQLQLTKEQGRTS